MWMDQLFQVFRHSDPDRMSQEQREATVDLLIWMMYADRKLSEAEHQQLTVETRDLPWDSPTRVEQYIDASIGRVRNAVGDSTSEEAYLAGIAARLGGDAARREAYAACERLAAADEKVAQQEEQLLTRVRQALEID